MTQVVGIFSRDGDGSYGFLTDFLRAEDFIREVRSVTITNKGFQNLREEASHCDSAILYHSKNRGRLNITNVTDSLYDNELRDLSRMLGKENVLVVADDLDSSSSEEKRKILRNQPLIDEMAAKLFLFSKTDKNSQDLLNEKLQKISSRLSRKVSRSEPILSVPDVPELIQKICNLPIKCFMMAAGVLQFIYNSAVQCIMQICNLPIQCFKMVVEVVQLIYDKAVQGVMWFVRLVQIIYNTVLGEPVRRRDVPL